MAKVFTDSVQDQTTTTGTGSVTPDGVAPAGHITIAAAYTTGNNIGYRIDKANQSEWEVGRGTWDGSVLSRDTVYQSSNSGALVNFTAGVKRILSTLVAADMSTASISDSSNRRYVTDAELIVIGNTSGTNSGDNSANSLYSGLTSSKQDTLVSGTTIKTINSTSLLGSGDIATATTGGKLSQFTATTSAELAGVISDETGSGSLVFGTSPKLSTPTLLGTVAQSITVERETTAATAGKGLTVTSGGATSGATDKNGGNLVLSSGIATGTGSSSIILQTATASTTGSSDRTPTTKLIVEGGGNLVLAKAQNTGIKVDVDTPTYGWRDIIGDITPRSSGGTAPVLTAFRGGNILCYAYAVNDWIDQIVYHMPHDYVQGTPVYLHVHWGHNGTAISGTFTVETYSTWCKGFNQSSNIFGAEVTAPISEVVTNVTGHPR